MTGKQQRRRILCPSSVRTGEIVLAYESIFSSPRVFFVPNAVPTITGVELILSCVHAASLKKRAPSSWSSSLVILNSRWSRREMLSALNSFGGRSQQPQCIYHEGQLGGGRLGDVELRDIRQLRRRSESGPQGPTWAAASSAELSAAAAEHDVHLLPSEAEDRPAIVLFTSGTTSVPKGVNLGLRSLLFQGFAKTRPPTNYSSSTDLLLSIPLCHIGGISSLLGVALARGTITLPPPPPCRMTLPEILHGNPRMVNSLVVVPALLSHFSGALTFPRVKLLLVGGSALSRREILRCRELFPNASIVQTYACTEAGSSITFRRILRERDAQVQSGNAEGAGFRLGTPIGATWSQHVEVKILDDFGVEVPHFTVGVIATRGPHVMSGYTSQAANESAFRSSGFFMTNDLGYFNPEKNEFYFCGRSTDTIRSGGETVLAKEVEDLILENFAQVKECAAFPLPDRTYGEIVCVALVLSSDLGIHRKEDAHPNSFAERFLDTIKASWQKYGIAGYKKPKKVFVLPSLPRNSNGKVVKASLTSQFGKNLLAKL